MMNYVNCGHVHPLIRRQERLFRLKTTAPPLGFFSDPKIELGSIQLLPADRLLLYTDGISEAENPKGEQFGHARIEAALMELDGDHLEFLEAVYQRILNFNSVLPPNDDSTAIVFDIHRPMPGD
jgi:serine phosphatase RsbU (regulator of sigma subunit)